MSSTVVISWPVWGSGSTLQRLLDQDPELGFLDHDVEGDQGAEGVFVGRGDEDRALQQRRLRAAGVSTSTVPILEASGQPAPGRESSVSRFEVGLRADRQPFGQGGVDGHPLGQGDDGLAGCRRRRARRGSVRPSSCDVEAEVQARSGSAAARWSAGRRSCGAKPSLPQPLKPCGSADESSWVRLRREPGGSERSGSPSRPSAPGSCQESTA